MIFSSASNDRDFHPTDIQEDADGSLIVLDTGGWYKLCCPTSQLKKPDVLGSIYRVRRLNAPKVVEPASLKIPWSKLTNEILTTFLDDPHPPSAAEPFKVWRSKGNPR